MRRAPAFTLLEVMVAVLILSLSMASLFSAQVQAVGATQSIKHVAVASQLARCRMSELEIEVLTEGFEVAELGNWDDGPCCELRDDEVRLDGDDPFTCRWKHETVTLPSITDAQDAAGDAAMEGNAEAQTGMMGMSLLGPMLPMVQNLLEAAIRKVTVQVVWQEGSHERSLEVVQYLTNPNQGELSNWMRGTSQADAEEDLGVSGGGPGGSGSGSGRGSGSGSGSGRGGGR